MTGPRSVLTLPTWSLLALIVALIGCGAGVLPVWVVLPVAAVYLGAVASIPVRVLLAVRRARRLVAEPMQLNEDGELSIPVLFPGESVYAYGTVDLDGRMILTGARVYRDDGTVRLESDWSTRR
jgi:hypothetical protein